MRRSSLCFNLLGSKKTLVGSLEQAPPKYPKDQCLHWYKNMGNHSKNHHVFFCNKKPTAHPAESKSQFDSRSDKVFDDDIACSQ